MWRQSSPQRQRPSWKRRHGSPLRDGRRVSWRSSRPARQRSPGLAGPAGPGPSTAWKIEKVLLHIELKRPTISTHFQRPLKELENSISGVRRRRQKVDGFSNNKRGNGSNTHPLKSAILRSRASRSEVRLRRSSHCDVTATSLRRRSLSHALTQTEWK